MSGSAICKTAFVVLWDKAIENMGVHVNWQNMESMKAQLETAFADSSDDYYATICNKPKEDGTPGYHVHLAITYPKARRISAIARELGNAHCEVMRGTKDQAVKYVNKEGEFEEKGEVVIERLGDPAKVKDNSGLRLDIGAVRALVASGQINASNLNSKALEMANSPVQVEQIKALYRQIKLAEFETAGERNVHVRYIEGETGTGKTYLATRANSDYFIVDCDERNAFPFNGYQGQKHLILDELRPGQFKPAYLFRLLDRYKLLLNVKGGQFPALWDTVTISTAYRLDEWFTARDDNKGQDNNRKQFQRRIHEHLITVVDERDQDGNVTKSHLETYEKRHAFQDMDERDLEECPFR